MKKTCKTLLALLLLAAALWGLCNAVTPLLTPKALRLRLPVAGL